MVRLRFESDEQVQLVKDAAALRGLAFNSFCRMATVGTARKVLMAPPEELLGQFLSDDVLRASQ